MKLMYSFLFQIIFGRFLTGSTSCFSCCFPSIPSIYNMDDQVMVILRKIPQESRKKLSGKGFFPQDGYILQYIPVPPNCLSVPDVSDGSSVMSSASTFICISIYNLIW